MNKLISFFFIIVLFSLLSSCYTPLLLTTAATSTTLATMKDRRIGETIDDTKILSMIKIAFIKNNFKSLYTKINVSVVQGRVLYVGIMKNQYEIKNAIDIAWKQTGVKEVINELKVDKNSKDFNIKQYTRDSIITAQIKSKFLLNKNIKFVNYTVFTINNIVYLFGIGKSEHEIIKAANIAATTYGVKRVISHVHLNM